MDKIKFKSSERVAYEVFRDKLIGILRANYHISTGKEFSESSMKGEVLEILGSFVAERISLRDDGLKITDTSHEYTIMLDGIDVFKIDYDPDNGTVESFDILNEDKIKEVFEEGKF